MNKWLENQRDKNILIDEISEKEKDIYKKLS